VIYVVTYGGAAYGWTRSEPIALAALARGIQRGCVAKLTNIEKRKSAPKHTKANEFLSPFNDPKAGFR
jgi:hypothetical protein